MLERTPACTSPEPTGHGKSRSCAIWSTKTTATPATTCLPCSATPTQCGASPSRSRALRRARSPGRTSRDMSSSDRLTVTASLPSPSTPISLRCAQSPERRTELMREPESKTESHRSIRSCLRPSTGEAQPSASPECMRLQPRAGHVSRTSPLRPRSVRGSGARVDIASAQQVAWLDRAAKLAMALPPGHTGGSGTGSVVPSRCAVRGMLRAHSCPVRGQPLVTVHHSTRPFHSWRYSHAFKERRRAG